MIGPVSQKPLLHHLQERNLMLQGTLIRAYITYYIRTLISIPRSETSYQDYQDSSYSLPHCSIFYKSTHASDNFKTVIHVSIFPCGQTPLTANKKEIESLTL